MSEMGDRTVVRSLRYSVTTHTETCGCHLTNDDARMQYGQVVARPCRKRIMEGGEEEEMDGVGGGR